MTPEEAYKRALKAAAAVANHIAQIETLSNREVDTCLEIEARILALPIPDFPAGQTFAGRPINAVAIGTYHSGDDA